MPIVLRLNKGSVLSYQELDNNFVDLDSRVQSLESSTGSSSDSGIPYTEDTANALQWVEGTYDFGNNIIKYANAIQLEADLANYSAATYHGMTMHVHETGALYYAHAGVWRKLLTDTAYNNVEGAGYVDPLADVAYGGSLDNLTDVKTSGSSGGIDHTPSDGQALVWDSSMNHWMPSDVSSTLSNLSDVDTTGVSSGQILKYDGAQWIPATDSTADSGSGITLEDLSVSVLPAGNAALSYDNTTGVFSFTPPDIGTLSYTTDSGNNLLYADGTYDFGSNIIKYANAVDQEADLANYDPGDYHGMVMHVHSTGGLYYAHAGAWRKLLTDISYNDAEGAGYVNPLSDVAYDGDYNSLSNTPAIPSTLTDIGISDGSNGQILSTDGAGNFSFVDDAGGASGLDDLTDVSVSGATSGQVLKYNGSTWEPATDLTAESGSGIALTDLSVSVQTAGTANLTYDNSTGVFSYTPPDLSSYALSTSVPTELTDLGITDGANGQVLTTDGSGTFTFTTVSGSGISNIVEDTTPQLGGELDTNGNTVGYEFSLGSTASSINYTFTDPGSNWFPAAETDPTLYLRRGETYNFTNVPGAHPLEIRVSNGGSAYNTGVVNNGGSGTVTFTVPMSAPSTLYYQCTVHSGMGNTINIV